MADDRYRWLDEEAAERLLRGLPVNARSAVRGGAPEEPAPGECGPGEPGEDRRSVRLAAALGGLTVEHPVAVELPGEAAAVDAFRASRAGVLRSGGAGSGGPDGVPVSGSGTAQTVGTVGIGRRRGGRRETGQRRASLAGRPLRAGVAMAVAGCALGGVAVAAGTGVLPTPFGGSGAPVTSVSPLASPGATDRQASGGGEHTVPGESDAPETADAGREQREGHGKDKGGEQGSSAAPSDDLAGPGGESRHDGGAAGGSGSRSPTPSAGRSGGGDGGAGDRIPDSEKQRLAAALCPAYEQKKIPADDRRKLERAAGGRKAVLLFCTKYESATAGGGSGRPGGNGGSGGGGSDSGGSASPGGSSGSGSSTGDVSGGSVAGGEDGDTGGSDDGGGSDSGGATTDSVGGAGSDSTSGSGTTGGGTADGGSKAASESSAKPSSDDGSGSVTQTTPSS